MARGRTVGELALGTAGTRAPYTDDDIAFATELARRLAVAIENARLYERERHIAATLQHSMLPEVVPDVPGLVCDAIDVHGEDLESAATSGMSSRFPVAGRCSPSATSRGAASACGDHDGSIAHGAPRAATITEATLRRFSARHTDSSSRKTTTWRPACAPSSRRRRAESRGPAQRLVTCRSCACRPRQRRRVDPGTHRDALGRAAHHDLRRGGRRARSGRHFGVVHRRARRAPHDPARRPAQPVSACRARGHHVEQRLVQHRR